MHKVKIENDELCINMMTELWVELRVECQQEELGEEGGGAADDVAGFAGVPDRHEHRVQLNLSPRPVNVVGVETAGDAEPVEQLEVGSRSAFQFLG